MGNEPLISIGAPYVLYNGEDYRVWLTAGRCREYFDASTPESAIAAAHDYLRKLRSDIDAILEAQHG